MCPTKAYLQACAHHKMTSLTCLSRHILLLHSTHVALASQSWCSSLCSNFQWVLAHVRTCGFTVSVKGLHLSKCNAMIQGMGAQLKAREEATSSAERRLDAESRALQQQRQEGELAGMKAQLAAQQQHSAMMSPLLQANPQLGGRSASRLQVCTMILGPSGSPERGSSVATITCIDMLPADTAYGQVADALHRTHLPLGFCSTEAS